MNPSAGLLFLGSGLLVLVYQLLTRRSALSVHHDYVHTVAIVLSTTFHPGSDASASSYSMTVQFEDVSGSLVQAKLSNKLEISKGARIRIAYNPSNPGWVVLPPESENPEFDPEAGPLALGCFMWGVVLGLIGVGTLLLVVSLT